MQLIRARIAGRPMARAAGAAICGRLAARPMAAARPRRRHLPAAAAPCGRTFRGASPACTCRSPGRPPAQPAAPLLSVRAYSSTLAGDWRRRVRACHRSGVALPASPGSAPRCAPAPKYVKTGRAAWPLPCAERAPPRRRWLGGRRELCFAAARCSLLAARCSPAVAWPGSGMVVGLRCGGDKRSCPHRRPLLFSFLSPASNFIRILIASFPSSFLTKSQSLVCLLVFHPFNNQIYSLFVAELCSPNRILPSITNE
jgi:hypothetical protein